MNKRNLAALVLVLGIFLASSGATTVYGQNTDNLADKPADFVSTGGLLPYLLQESVTISAVKLPSSTI